MGPELTAPVGWHCDSLQSALQTSEVRNLKCFRGSENHIATTKDELIGSMITDFLRLAKTATRPLAGSKHRKDGNPPSSIALPQDEMEEEESLHLSDRMLPLVLSLHRTGSLGDAIKTFFDFLEQTLKSSMAPYVSDLTREGLSGEEAGAMGTKMMCGNDWL